MATNHPLLAVFSFQANRITLRGNVATARLRSQKLRTRKFTTKLVSTAGGASFSMYGLALRFLSWTNKHRKGRWRSDKPWDFRSFNQAFLGASMKGFESKAVIRLVLQHLEHILQWPLHLLATHQVATRPTLRGADLWDMLLASDSFEAWWPNQKAWTYTLNRRDKDLLSMRGCYRFERFANLAGPIQALRWMQELPRCHQALDSHWTLLVEVKSQVTKSQGTPRKFGAPAASPSSRRRTEMFLSCKA